MSDMQKVSEEAQAAMVRYMATGLDALVELGVQVTPEQYKQALVDAACQETHRSPRPVYRPALETAIVEHIAWWRARFEGGVG